MHTLNNRQIRNLEYRLTKRFRTYSLFFISVGLLMSSQSFGITLQQAETMALEADPIVMSHQATSRALLDESISNNALPDPKFRLGLFNLPVDSLSTTQEPSTQLRLGIQQAFPRGDSLDINQEKSRWLSKSAIARSENAKRLLLRELRETFLNLYYELRAGSIINETRELFSNLVKTTEAQYAAGRVNQQDVIQAELELSRLEDRGIRINSKEDEYRAQLALWIGQAAWGLIDNHFPALVELPRFNNNSPDDTNLNDINSILIQHPSVLIETTNVEASRKSTELARQDYKPGYSAFVEYRKRDGSDATGNDREDMLAAMVTMDIPLFTENRQDKKVSANLEKTKAAVFRRDDQLRTLKRMLDKDLAIYKRLGQRESIYRQDLLKSAKNNSAASLNAYKSGVSEFTTLMRAQITELDVRLADLRIRVDRKRAQARLLYITGETHIKKETHNSGEKQ